MSPTYRVTAPSEARRASAARRNTLRLSFVTVPPVQIDEGIARLASLVQAQA
ncbi:hypothetical protein [Mycetohabitans sp. B46]|uniref:hypothetical protein n=1 Tax=Mycetohabitans sp. B46 TaxID=2772536 RepID=UPI00307DF271